MGSYMPVRTPELSLLPACLDRHSYCTIIVLCGMSHWSVESVLALFALTCMVVSQFIHDRGNFIPPDKHTVWLGVMFSFVRCLVFKQLCIVTHEYAPVYPFSGSIENSSSMHACVEACLTCGWRVAIFFHFMPVHSWNYHGVQFSCLCAGAGVGECQCYCRRGLSRSSHVCCRSLCQPDMQQVLQCRVQERCLPWRMHCYLLL
jgi:hypothetical protein